MITRLCRALLAMLFLTLSNGSADAQRRLALVVGINKYDYIPLLRNAENDAVSMALTLRQIGFDEVTATNNLPFAELSGALAGFAKKIKEGDTALFFFAGHGYNDGAQDLLMPSDIKRFSNQQIDEIRNESLSAGRVLNLFQNKGARFAIVIIDTCRRNPFENSPGFDGPLRIIIRTPLQIPVGVTSESFEMYSAGPQQQALDRLSEEDTIRNSVFTRVLLKHLLSAPPKPLQQVARSVRAEVERVVKQGDPRRKQTPTFVSNITEDFYLTPQSFKPAAISQPLELRIRPTGAEAVTLCDRLAAAPDDEQRPAQLKGVRREFLEALPAIEACEAALVASGSNVRLKFELGRAYWANGEDDKARAAFEEAASQGYAAAETALVEMVYLEDKDGEQDYSEEAQASLRRAMSRNARAETYLGLMTIRGQARPYYRSGSDQAYAVGARHLRRAFDRNDPEAAFWLGIMAYKGRGMAPNYRLAESYFNRAAKTGHRRAILHLGSLYRDWRDDQDHLTKAKSYWETAARLGSGQATENLAAYYEKGQGGVPDRQKACELYEKAAELGNTSAWSKYIASCPALARQRRTELNQPSGNVDRSNRLLDRLAP